MLSVSNASENINTLIELENQIKELINQVVKIIGKKGKEKELNKISGNINQLHADSSTIIFEILENEKIKKLFDNWSSICELEYINTKEKDIKILQVTKFLLGKIITNSFVEIFLKKLPLTKENYIKIVKENFGFYGLIKFGNNNEYIEKSWILLEIFFNYKESENCLYLHNIGRNKSDVLFDKYFSTLYHEKLYIQRQENKELKHEKLLQNFCSKRGIRKEIFYELPSGELIYPMLFGKEITKLFKINKYSVGHNDEIIHGGMYMRSQNLPKLLSHHSYISKTFRELFFNPFLFGSEYEKGGHQGLENLRLLLEKAQETIKNTSSLQTYTDIVSYLQLRYYGSQERRCLVIILPQKYLDMDQNKLLGFQILPKEKSPKFDILSNQIDDYDNLINGLSIGENQTILPCNNLCLVYDAESLSLITSYPISENKKNSIRDFINQNQIEFLIS